MIGTILSALMVGLIVGALARLIMPGKQNIGMIMTISSVHSARSSGPG